MVLCVYSDRLLEALWETDKEVSFYRIPAIFNGRSAVENELSKKRRNGFLAAISREGLTNKRTIEFVHLISVKPSYLFDKNNPDWLPSLHLGYEKQMSADVSRWERAKKRSSSLLPKYSDAVDDASVSLSVDENNVSASVPVDSDENRVSVSLPVDENSVCAYTQTEESSSVVDLRKKLADCRSIIEDMSKRLSEILPPFCIKSLQKDDDVRFYTGLPNARVLKAVFDHVTSSQTCLATFQKLSSFQQFVLMMMKIQTNSFELSKSGYCVSI